jgi:hypothetical protein
MLRSLVSIAARDIGRASVALRHSSVHRKSALRRVAPLLALTTLAVGLLPAGAAAGQTQQRPPAATAGWSPLGTLDPQHVNTGSTELILYGAFLFTPNEVSFTPKVMPASVRSLVVPYIRQAAAGSYAYRLVFHLRPSTTTTHFQLDSRAPVEVAAGTATVEFIVTVQTDGPSWNYWVLTNADRDSWGFDSCEIYQQTS